MASTQEFVEYVCDYISDAGQISYRKMFGVYCNGKIISGDALPEPKAKKKNFRFLDRNNV